jgi:hypothetical protein
MKSRCKTPSAAENIAFKAEWPVGTDERADERAIDIFHNVVLLCEEDMKTWMTPSLFVPQGSTLAGEITIIE